MMNICHALLVLLLLSFLPPSYTLSNSNTGNIHNNYQEQKLKLLSFDLDDTLFPISETLRDANAVMIDQMTKLGAKGVTEQSIRQASVGIRQGLNGKPITYSELRSWAIEQELVRRCSLFDLKGSVYAMAGQVFDAWLTERQRAANRRLFPGVTETLKTLREQYPDTVFAAITNGRGSPMEMPSLAPYFDLCVSGEDDDVFPHRKPNRGIYEVALYKAGLSAPPAKGSWIHVGDDLANDVGGSADCGAYAVHATIIQEDRPDFWSTASELEQEERKKKDDEAQSKVSARIQQVDELPQVIAQLLMG